MRCGDYQAAIAIFQEQLRLALHQNNSLLVCIAHLSIGKAARAATNTDVATEHLNHALTFSKHISEKHVLAEILFELSALQAGNVEKAREHYTEACGLVSMLGDEIDLRTKAMLEEYKTQLSTLEQDNDIIATTTTSTA
jgi:tetratricopeptide (TPR) repeat protein